MSLENQWIATEERLLCEASSLGEFLRQLRSRISPQLVGDQTWEAMLERARNLPAAMAAFPFGFELPLHDLRPVADLGVSVIGGGRSAAFFEEKGNGEGADASLANIAWLLGQTESEESILRRIAGRKMLLEYDIDIEPCATPPDPGIFLYPDKDVLIGDGDSQRLRDLGVVVDAVAFSTGLELSAEERRQIERVYLSMEPDTCIRAVGAFPSRKGGIRLAVTGFKKAGDIVSFLERTGWPGQGSVVDAVVSRLEERDAFAYAGVHFDIDADGVGPTLGLSFYAREGQWLKDVKHWTPLIDGIEEIGLAVPEKLTELVNWSSGSEPLSGRSGQFVLVRGIHHIKLTVIEDKVEQAKGYIFLLMFAWPLTAGPTG